jgi:hypothetical protein
MRSSRNGRLRAHMWMAPPRRSAKWRGGLASTIHRCSPNKIWLICPEWLWDKTAWIYSAWILCLFCAASIRPFRAQNFSERERLDSASWALRWPFGPSQ